MYPPGLIRRTLRGLWWLFCLPFVLTGWLVLRWVLDRRLRERECRATKIPTSADFDNDRVPDMSVLVTGGKLGDAARERIEGYMEDRKTAENFHKILVLENAERLTIESLPKADSLASVVARVKQRVADVEVAVDAFWHNGVRVAQLDDGHLAAIVLGFDRGKWANGNVAEVEEAKLLAVIAELERRGLA